MKIALCQMNILWEEKGENREKICRQVELAAGQAADFIVFPEMCLTGFSMNIQKTMEQDEESLEFFLELALRYGIFIGFGWVKAGHTKNRAENHFTIVTPQGQILTDYTKIHPFRYAGEHEVFDAGNAVVKGEIGDFMLSTFICYDLRFPEIFQAVSGDCQLLVLAANWPEKRREHWRCLLRARAIENQVYIAAVNCVGETGGITYGGDSCVIAPDGRCLAELSDREGLVVVELTNDVEPLREKFPMKKDRRTELYKELL